MKVTDNRKGDRLVRIMTYLIRNRTRKYTAMDIYNYFSSRESVSLRNIQRDLVDLSHIQNSHVCQIRERGKLYYQIEPDMRSKLTLPIQRNSILAFFLLKRIQPFFAPHAKTFEELTETVASNSAQSDFELFEDLDAKLEESTFLFGEQSPLALDGNLFNDLITSLIEKRKLKILYAGANYEKPQTKIICPAKLILFKGELYFICMSEYQQKWDFYIKLCRILKAELTKKTFTPDPARIKRIEKRLVSSFGILDKTDPEPCDILIQFPPNEYYQRIFTEKKYHHSQKLSTDKDGNAILTMCVPVGMDLINWILSWPEAVVLEPKALRKELHRTGEKLAQKYKGR